MTLVRSIVDKYIELYLLPRQVGAALPKCKWRFLWGPVQLLTPAARLSHLTQRHLWPRGHRSLHGALLPRRHVSYVPGRHFGCLSDSAESTYGKVSDGAKDKSQVVVKVTNTKINSAFCARFSGERPALNVVIYPLQHEDLPSVIRDIPLTLLDTITLFQSHVAQPPHLSPY